MYSKKHIDITARVESAEYSSPSSGGSNFPVRARAEHGTKLAREFAAAIAEFQQRHPQSGDVQQSIDGTYLEFEVEPSSDPNKAFKKRGIEPLTSKVYENSQLVGLFVPSDADEYFTQAFSDFANEEKTTRTGKPPLNAMIAPIQAIKSATFRTFWTDLPERIPSNDHEPTWWEIWCKREKLDKLRSACEIHRARIASETNFINFTETSIVPILATKEVLETILFSTTAINEIRLGGENVTFFTDSLDRSEQIESQADFVKNVNWPAEDAPAVCILDTGVNRASPIIEPTLKSNDLLTVDTSWGVDDTGSHGTLMAGIALLGDVSAALQSTQTINIEHRLESVKILPPQGLPPNEEKYYGTITSDAISIAEAQNPFRSRVYAMAVTNDLSGYQPTSWSATFDREAFGATIVGEEEAPKRLFIISSGNADETMQLDQVEEPDIVPIQDPAQAWNALVIGGYTDKVSITESDLDQHIPASNAGELSPFSRTSTLWTKRNSPIRPDIVFEAGNKAKNEIQNDIVAPNSLSLLTTGAQTSAPFVSFNGTSAATAGVAYMAAMLLADENEYWPEMIRALLVHSARWTEPMLAELNQSNPNAALKRFGFGVPSLERAKFSANNDLALVVQKNIQPFKKQKADKANEIKGGLKFNECHYYKIPWPQAALESLGDKLVTMKVTLSYFIEPNPGSLSADDPYLYQSYGLRFDLKRSLETDAAFRQRVNKSERTDEYSRAESEDKFWRFGPRSFSCGSLHCDEWIGPAANLITRDEICIKPVMGWWRNRADAETVQKKGRYALVVSLKTDEQDIDFYTEVSSLIQTDVDIDVENGC